MSAILLPLSGGVLIGLAASIMLLLNGRVTGVSGIINNALGQITTDSLWRFSFIGGLIFGGACLLVVLPTAFVDTTSIGLGASLVAGWFVGFGTVMGGGCTSGHGVCGVSRMSPRSLVATITFVLVGMLTATVIRIYCGGVL